MFVFYEQSEAVTWRCSVKNLLLKISKTSQENTGDGVSFSPCDFCLVVHFWRNYSSFYFEKQSKTEITKNLITAFDISRKWLSVFLIGFPLMKGHKHITLSFIIILHYYVVNT